MFGEENEPSTIKIRSLAKKMLFTLSVKSLSSSVFNKNKLKNKKKRKKRI